MKGALTVRTWPERTIIVLCDECGREGRFTASLAARFGWERAMPDVLHALTSDCSRNGSGLMARSRRAVFVDPQTGEQWRR